MSYTINQKTGEITIGGFEKGIASSPHAGIADSKCLNIGSMPGEVMVSYSRTQQSQTNQSGTLTFNSTNTVTHSGSDIVVGQSIIVSGSSDGNIPNGQYFVTLRVSSTQFKLATSYGGSALTANTNSSASFVTVNMNKPIAWSATSSSAFPNYDYFVLDSQGLVWYSRPSGAQTWALINPDLTFATGIFCLGSYVFICEAGTTNALRYKSLGALGTAWTAFQDLNYDTGNSGLGTLGMHYSFLSSVGYIHICDGSNIDTLFINPGSTFDPTNSATYTWTSKALILPNTELATTIAEIASGNNGTVVIGGTGSILYPWDGASSSYGAVIHLPEYNTFSMVTVNNLVYVFVGFKGNIYVTNGGSVTSVMTVPDYIADNTGTNQDPYFIWGGTMYLRGRIWFSVKASNCGGIWSFIPTPNYYIQQDTGASLRMENQNSYGTYSGYAPVLFPALNPNDQATQGAQYFSGWDSGSSTYGIDYSSSNPFTGGAIVETDLIPTGTFLSRKTFQQIEYKVAQPLATNESIQLYYRLNLSDAFTTCGNVSTDSVALSGYFSVNFQNTQWVQFRAVLTAVNSGSFCRLVNLYLR